MDSYILIIRISLVIIIVGVPVALGLTFKKELQKAVIPLVFGFLIALITKKLMQPAFYWFLKSLIPSVWTHKVVYGLVYGVSAGAFSEAIRYGVLFLCLKLNKELVSGVKKCIALGLGQAWVMGYILWGDYLVQLLKVAKEGQLDKYGLTLPSLLFGFSEVLIMALLLVGMTFIQQYGMETYQQNITFVEAAIYHSVAISLTYYIPYLFRLPMIVSQIVFLIMAVASLYFGHRMLAKEEQYS